MEFLFTFFVQMAPLSNAEKCRRYREKYRDENVAVVSEASDHSRIVAFTCISKVFNHIRENMICH